MPPSETTYRVEDADTGPVYGDRLVYHSTTLHAAARGYAVGLVGSDYRLDRGLRLVRVRAGEPETLWTYDPEDVGFAVEVERWLPLVRASLHPERN